MRREKLNLFTFYAIAGIVFIISIIELQFFLRVSSNRVTAVQIENSKREANQLSYLIGTQISDGIPKETAIKNLQKTIQKTNTKTSYISLINYSGKQISYLEKKKADGLLNLEEASSFGLNNNGTNESLNKFSKKQNIAEKLGTVFFQKNDAEFIYIAPVMNSNWLIAAHVNIDKISKDATFFKQRFFFICGITSIFIIFLVFFAVRILFNLYEKSTEHGIKVPEALFLKLASSNSKPIELQQNSTAPIEEKTLEKISTGMNKKRILTYHRNELITIPIENIAFIYLEHATTYVMSFDGKKSSTNASLDELYASLDNVTFYRANRQVIINVKTIQKIIKYGNNQLKIIVQPNLETAIIIGKNKASEFKQWLNF
jgi:hypothetical protein